MKIKALLLCMGCFAMAQAQQLRPDVLAAAGNSLSDPSNSARINFTVGEVVILGQSLPSFSYGQGFHNAALQKVAVTDLDLLTWGIEVWPNPVSQMLFLQFTPPSEKEFLEASVWNLLGQPVVQTHRLGENGTQNIAVSQLPTGVYLLRLASNLGSSATVKFVKAY